MPHVNIWIRRGDYAKWQAIHDKPKFLHRAINSLEDSDVGEEQGEDDWYVEALKGYKHDYSWLDFRYNKEDDVIEVFHIGQQKWLNVDEVDLTN